MSCFCSFCLFRLLAIYHIAAATDGTSMCFHFYLSYARFSLKRWRLHFRLSLFFMKCCIREGGVLNHLSTVFTTIRVMAYYVKLLIVPSGLCADYLTFPVSVSIKQSGVILSAGIIACLLYLGFYLVKRLRHVSFGIFLFFITLGPVMNIIPLRILLAERFLYFPLLGYALSLAVLFNFLVIRWRRRPLLKYIVLFFQIAIIFVYSNISMIRNNDWADPIVFNQKILERYPDNYRAATNLAIAYRNIEGNIEKARLQLEKAREIEPDSYKTRELLAACYIQENRFQDAVSELRYVLILRPDYIGAYKLLAYVYIRMGKHAQALKQYRNILVLDQSNEEARDSIKDVERMIHEASGE